MKALVRFTDPGAMNSLVPFVVKVSSSFTVPEKKTGTSPTSYGSDTRNNTTQDVVGGQLLLAANDGAAGTASVFDLTKEGVADLYPGDVVAIGAVAANVADLTVTSKDGTVRTFKITGITTTATAVGFYG